MKRALLVMDYGTPGDTSEIRPYFEAVRGNRPVSDDDLAWLTHRYKAIGGVSPLGAVTSRQAAQVFEGIQSAYPEDEWTLFEAHKFVSPTLEEVGTIINEGPYEDVVAVIMSPFASHMVESGYMNRLTSTLTKPVELISGWSQSHSFIQFWAKSIDRAYRDVLMHKTLVLFTAHSVPTHTLGEDDGYVPEITAAVERVARHLSLTDYDLAWQSGSNHGKWLEPTVSMVTKAAAMDGYEAIIYVPIGFTCSHLEVLYDNDIECKGECQALGMMYKRADMPDDSPLYVASILDRMGR